MKMSNLDTSSGLGALRTAEKLHAPEETEILAEKIKARMRNRTELHRRNRDLRRAAFSFGLFTRLPERNYQREAEQTWWDSWEEAGDHLRLAMLEWRIGRYDDAV